MERSTSAPRELVPTQFATAISALTFRDKNWQIAVLGLGITFSISELLMGEAVNIEINSLQINESSSCQESGEVESEHKEVFSSIAAIAGPLVPVLRGWMRSTWFQT